MNKKNIHNPLVIVTIIVWTLFLLSCRGNPVDSTEVDAGGPGIIIPGQSIDGVKLGDTRDEVDELLGEPSNVGWADGYRRAWRTYTYKPPAAEGLGFSILFIEEEDLSWGPVDMLMVHKPYDGKTPEGIGIGSTLSEVKEAYGEPDFASEGELKDGKIQGSNLYCINSKRFYIGILDGIVETITVSFFIPTKSAVHSCE